MTTHEDEAHFTLWCLMAWPLIMGHDIRNQTETTKRILTNPGLLAISQDPMGKPAWLVGGASQISQLQQVYVRQLANGDWAAALFNRDDNMTVVITLQWSDLGMLPQQPAFVHDL